MLLAVLIIGISTGFSATVIALMAGYSFMLALAFYPLFGVIGVLIAAAAITLCKQKNGSTSRDMFADLAG